jgi:hypothetical protein
VIFNCFGDFAESLQGTAVDLGLRRGKRGAYLRNYRPIRIERSPTLPGRPEGVFETHNPQLSNLAAPVSARSDVNSGVLFRSTRGIGTVAAWISRRRASPSLRLTRTVGRCGRKNLPTNLRAEPRSGPKRADLLENLTGGSR